jgi:hypothetical protein
MVPVAPAAEKIVHDQREKQEPLIEPCCGEYQAWDDREARGQADQWPRSDHPPAGAEPASNQRSQQQSQQAMKTAVTAAQSASVR